MINIILFDDDMRDELLPITFTRPVGEIRIGILTIKEKWEKWMNAQVSFITQDYLSEKYPINIQDTNYVISGSVLPSHQLCRLINQLEFNEALLKNGDLIAAKLNASQFEHLIKNEDIEELEGFELEETSFLKINHLTDIFKLNAEALASDFELLTKGRKSQTISSTNQVLAPENIFLEEGAEVEFAILNASNGPIYVGKNAKILEGAMVKNGLAIGEGSMVKMGAKMYGATTLGPYCKVGGEVKNAILTGYSSKGHEGYLGNSVIGEWCNLGADTNTSNLKNNYAKVKLWNYSQERFVQTDEQFCGLIMGDHSKCGINTMFNTGTVVGVFANIFGAGFPRNFVPSFSWGGASGFSSYKLEKVFETATIVMQRRKLDLTEVDKNILAEINKLTRKHRRWENNEPKERVGS